jgi:hypothetical protein
MLEHWAAGKENDALAGDLLEEFCGGRSAGWYWRQVLAAVAIGWLVEIVNHRAVLLFTALWSMLTPAWLLAFSGIEDHFRFSQRVWQMDWPWSSVCDLGALLAANLLFIWTGIFLYLVPHLWATKKLSLRPLLQGLRSSFPVLVTVWAALVILPAHFIGGCAVEQHSVDPVSSYSTTHAAPVAIQRVSVQEQWDVKYGERVINPYFNPRYAIADMRTEAILVRLPFFLSVLCSLWGVTSRRRRKQVAE